jgi:uncharacterized protein YqfA (UPF0365 family)
MNTKDVFILLVFILFFCAVLLIVYFLPIFITKLRAYKNGLKLTFRQSRIIVKNHCVNDQFLSGIKEILTLTDIPIEKLTLHHLAGGNLLNLQNGIVEMKRRNKDIDFHTLSMFDLAGRDLILEIEKAESRNWKFELTD